MPDRLGCESRPSLFWVVCGLGGVLTALLAMHDSTSVLVALTLMTMPTPKNLPPNPPLMPHISVLLHDGYYVVH